MLNPAPLITVLMPVYNGEKFLRESISSVLAQSLADFEFLIVDDGSSDRTSKIIESYSDPRIKLLRQCNMGIAKSLNRGLELARGKYVARMDADDICRPDRFMLQIKYLTSHPDCVAVGSQLADIDHAGNFIDWRLVPLFHGDIVRRMLSGRGGQVPHPAAMFRRQGLLRIGGYRQVYELAEDLDLFLRLSEVGKLANLPRQLVFYRVHGGSVSEQFRPKQLEVAAMAARDALARQGKCSPYRSGILFDLKYMVFKRLMRVYLSVARTRGYDS